MFTDAKMSLCNSHDTISYWTRDVKKNIKKAIKNKDYSKLEEIIPTLNIILEETRAAKKKGQKLENRCRAYRSHIEDLGFQRVG